MVQQRPRAVVITGASTGIGAATAELLAREGFTVFAGFRTSADGERLAARHPNIRPLRLDVTDEASIADAAAAVSDSALALQGLVNNAGIALGGPLEFVPVDAFRGVFEVNVFGAIAVVQAFLPQLRNARGRIVFVGSISGRLTSPLAAPYSASKFALRAVADAMRLELSSAGIAVSIVEPGSVRTPIWRKARASSEEMLRQMESHARAYYGREMDAALASAEREERTAMPVERVAKTIQDALTSPRPRATYLVGSNIASLFALLPAGFRDRLLLALMRRR